MSEDGSRIPQELRDLDQWVMWRHATTKNGHPTKIPYCTAAPGCASSTDSKTWGCYAAAGHRRELFDGIGFVVSRDDPYVGIDMDLCVNEGGEIHPAALEIIELLDSYTELSPSGLGIRILFRAGELPGTRRKQNPTPWHGWMAMDGREDEFAVYRDGRYFTITGEPLDGYGTIHDRTDQLAAVYERMFPRKEKKPRQAASAGPPGGSNPDAEILRRAMKARNGEQFSVLWSGGDDAYASTSEADLALCAYLAFWTGPNPGRIDALFRQSQRIREKWDERRGESTYGAQTVEKALEGRTEFFDWTRTRKRASRAKSTEHTEHSQKNGSFAGEKVFGGVPNTDRTPTEQSPPELASEERILDIFDKKMAELGLIGERHIARAVYLVHISRLLSDPCRAVVKGDSSTGKSFAAGCGLLLAAPEWIWVRTGTSPLAMFYSEENFEHRTLVFYEANKLAEKDDPLAAVLRTLISEGKLAYEVTDVRSGSTKYLEKLGPVAFLSTTTKAALDDEIETRILSLHSDGSDEMTAAVVEAILKNANSEALEVDFGEWHHLDRWLAANAADVFLPWAPALAKFKLKGPPRLRRDIKNLLALGRAHALLHRATREVDSRGRVIATLADYEVARGVLAGPMSIATDRAVRDGTRAIVEAVGELRAEKRDTVGAERWRAVSIQAAARKAGRSVSTTHTDVHDALHRGYLIDESNNPRTMDLDIGIPMPIQGDLIPSPEELQKAMGST